MADRFPLIANTGHSQIQEIPSGDNLNLSNNSIVGVGSVTATSFVGDGSGLTGVASTDNIRTNTNATFLQNVNVSGTVTATSYSGSGANLTSLPAANLTGTLPAISGANLTNISSGMTLVHKAVVSSASTTYFVDFTNLDYDSVYKIIGKRVHFSSPNYVRFRPYLNGGSSPTSNACEYNYTYYYGGYSNDSGTDWTINDSGYYSSSYGYNAYFEFDFTTGYGTWARATGHYFSYTQSMCDMWGWLSSSYTPYTDYRVSGIRIHNGSSGYFNADSEILLYKYNES